MLTREQWDALVKEARLKARPVTQALLTRYFFGVMQPDGICCLFEPLDLDYAGMIRLLQKTKEVILGFPPSIVNALGAERICGCNRRQTPTLLTREEVIEHVEVILDICQHDKIVVVGWGTGTGTDVLSVPRQQAAHYLRRRMNFHCN